MRWCKKRRPGRRLPDLTVVQILDWADAHHARTGQWPNVDSGEVYDAPAEKWRGLDMDLRRGFRGLPGGSSLAQLLARERDVRNIKGLPDLLLPRILAWADTHHARTGRWPTRQSGSIVDAPGETWLAVETALAKGLRGLPGGSSLAQLLCQHRSVRNHMALPALSVETILAWADAHYTRTGQWPQATSGSVIDAPGETWNAVDIALAQGNRGLPGQSSLPRLLAEYRGVRNRSCLSRLTIKEILAWANAFRERNGRRPTARSGAIAEAPSETWLRVDTALREGLRGLAGGSSLPRLLRQHDWDKGQARVKS